MMRPINGSHRVHDPYRAWCRNQFNLLAEGGIWGVPRSGLQFQRQGEVLALIARMPHHPNMPVSAANLARYQQGEFELTRKRFASAGITVIDKSGDH